MYCVHFWHLTSEYFLRYLPRSTNWSSPVTSMTDRSVVLQLTPRWWGLVSSWYRLTSAALGKAYLCTLPLSLAIMSVLSLAVIPHIGSLLFSWALSWLILVSCQPRLIQNITTGCTKLCPLSTFYLESCYIQYFLDPL